MTIAAKVEERPPSPGAGPLPIATFTAEMLRHYSASGRGQTSLLAVRQVLAQFAELADVRTVADLDDGAIRRFIDRQPAGLAPHTHFSRLAVLRAICNHAHRMGLIPAPPAFPFIPQPNDRCGVGGRVADPVLTPGEVARVLAHLGAGAAASWGRHRLYALTATVAYTGLLRDEALWLNLGDCDLAAGVIRVRRREAFARSAHPPLVCIPAALAPILRAWLPEAGPEFVFPNKTRSNAWTGGPEGERPSHEIRRAGIEAGVAGVNFESLRRFFLAHAAPSIAHEPAATAAIIPVGGPHRVDRGAGAGLASRARAGDDRPRPSPPLDAPRAPAAAGPSRPTRPWVFTVGDATRLMAHLLKRSGTWEGHRLYALAATILYTGLPRGRVLDLAPGDCDFDGRTIRVAGRAMAQPMPPDLARILAEWIPHLGGCGWLFPGTRLIGPWTGGRPGDKPLQRLQAEAREAGIEALVFESLRAIYRHQAGAVSLGEEYRSLTPPGRTPDGPRPRPPGPMPKGGGGRRPYDPPARRRAREVMTRADPAAGPGGEGGGPATSAGPASGARMAPLLGEVKSDASPMEAAGACDVAGGKAAPRPAVLALPGRDRPPVVRGVPMGEPLRPRFFNILQAMVAAGCLEGRRLSEKELAKKSGHSNPVRELNRHRKAAPWDALLDFPGGKGRGGYGFKIT